MLILLGADMFQSTPPRGRRHRRLGVCLEHCAFQSTPPRGRRHKTWQGYRHGHTVSIHASAREATKHKHHNQRNCQFQSTPPRGRRLGTFIYPVASFSFQSTPPRGRRRSIWAGLNYEISVSIHASAREATHGAAKSPAESTGFNPRLRAGGDNG